jgi:hypothetical protein
MQLETQRSVAVFGDSFRRARRLENSRAALSLVNLGVREAGVEPAPPKGPSPKPGVSTVPPLARRLEVSVLSSEDIVNPRSRNEALRDDLVSTVVFARLGRKVGSERFNGCGVQRHRVLGEPPHIGAPAVPGKRSVSMGQPAIAAAAQHTCMEQEADG